MKKIGILTLYGYLNYGNRFQNYAVQEIVKKYGYQTETIVVYSSYKPLFKTIVCRFLALWGNVQAQRYIKFYKFSHKYIPIRVFVNSKCNLPDTLQYEYQYFVTGSDQVWNPYVRKKERDIFFLKFANQNQRICIAPSFGITCIEEQFKEKYVDGLNGFNRLSCREQAGISLIQSLTGRDADLLIDPTLALEPKNWQEIAVNPIDNSKNFILVAMLGKVDDSQMQIVNRIAEMFKLNIVNIFDSGSVYGPEEALGLINQASLVFTDSFHFTAFSINFNIPFVVTHRNDDIINSATYSRITSLLSLFHLESRAYDQINEIDNLLFCDFAYSNSILKRERIKFFDYIEAEIGVTK